MNFIKIPGTVEVSNTVDVTETDPVTSVTLHDPADDTRKAEFDSVFKIPVTIDVAHHEVHEGDSFNTNVSDPSMTNADTLIFAFKTAAGTKRAHTIVEFTTLTGGDLDIIEGPTWTNESGTLNAIYNRKREASMNSSTFLEDSGQASFTATDNVILNPTGLSGGTVIATICAFGQKNAFSGRGRDIAELILKPDTQYAYRFTATDNLNAAQIILTWYEHTDE